MFFRKAYIFVKQIHFPANSQFLYKLYLPSEEELKAEIETQKEMFYLQKKEMEE